MNIQQLFRLGEVAKTEKKYTLAVPWLELTIQRLLEDQQDSNSKMINSVRVLLWAAMMEVNVKSFQIPTYRTIDMRFCINLFFTILI